MIEAGAHPSRLRALCPDGPRPGGCLASIPDVGPWSAALFDALGLEREHGLGPGTHGAALLAVVALGISPHIVDRARRARNCSTVALVADAFALGA